MAKSTRRGPGAAGPKGDRFPPAAAAGARAPARFSPIDALTNLRSRWGAVQTQLQDTSLPEDGGWVGGGVGGRVGVCRGAEGARLWLTKCWAEWSLPFLRPLAQAAPPPLRFCSPPARAQVRQQRLGQGQVQARAGGWWRTGAWSGKLPLLGHQQLISALSHRAVAAVAAAGPCALAALLSCPSSL